MRKHKRAAIAVMGGLAVLSLGLGAMVTFQASGAHAAANTGAAISGTTRTISSGGTTSFTAAAQSDDTAIQSVEFPDQADGDAADAAGGNSRQGVNRSYSGATKGNGQTVSASAQAKSNPELNLSFDGLNFRQQRLANGGNQFSVEPPDQGMCVGNGFVFESNNDVARVFHTDGTPAGPVVDLNTFYGYPAAIARNNHNLRGPFVTDPTCIFDQATGHFFNVVLTIEDSPTTGADLGPNHLDLAVSNTADPTGPWTIYRLPVQDDGTQGTPNHNCVDGPCFGDYPHIGADANGIYLTTNEYDFFGNGFHGAQVYAMSKTALASLAPSVAVTQFDTATAAPGGKPGFTVWPAQSPANQFNSDNGGTEFFLSSTAADEAQCDSEAQGCGGTGMSSTILQWSLTNTSSLNSASPSLSLSNRALTVNQYAIPPKSDQKAGGFPLGQCLNTPSCSTTFILGQPDPYTEVISHLDSNDTRMQQVTYANGKLWGALDTDVIVNGAHKAGIAYYIVNPNAGKLSLQGTLALANNNLTYPAIGVLPNGRGVMAFTVVGADYYPSAGYAGLDDKIGAGAVHIAAEGLGPDDGFTSYKAEVGNPPRTRWGDYGAASVDGNTIWITSEYIGQTCTLAQYTAAPFGSCGGTRATLGNWGTRISQVTP